jgi:hypothetical protein
MSDSAWTLLGVALASAFAGLAFFAIKTGRTSASTAVFTREEQPVMFWWATSLYVVFAILMTVSTVWEFLD